jgi:S1-C subfamily serine protease
MTHAALNDGRHLAAGWSGRVCWSLVACAAWLGLAAGEAARGAPQETIAAAARKVVKIHGAGGVRGLEAYQTGILVSSQGHILTVMSTVLDADEIDCVLDDGRRYRGRLVGVDPARELALLEIEAEELPAFALDATEPVPVGTRVLALSNLFGVALGDERVSAQHGVVAALVPLDARRGAYEVPYRGNVYLLDCTTSNPGSPGGALVDFSGRLVGMLGKELRAAEAGVWLNYAVPTPDLAASFAAIRSGAAAMALPTPPGQAAGFDPTALGLVLVPDLLDRTPPFIETILAESPADRAGLRPDDLVIAVGGMTVASRAAVQRALAAIAAGDPVRLAVVRSGTIVECDLGPRPEPRRNR